MSALTIMIIRHAEKPDGAFPGDGTTIDGKTDDLSLVVRGWQRAGTWAGLFGAGTGGDFPRPDIVYAADPDQASGQGDVQVSRRPFETSLPLCERLHLTPVTAHGVGDEAALLAEVTKLTGTVLICWEHKKIGKAILPGLAGDQTLPQLPAKWDGDRFDVVLRFDRVQDGAGWSFRQLFPRLLSGDSDVPLGV